MSVPYYYRVYLSTGDSLRISTYSQIFDAVMLKAPLSAQSLADGAQIYINPAHVVWYEPIEKPEEAF